MPLGFVTATSAEPGAPAGALTSTRLSSMTFTLVAAVAPNVTVVRRLTSLPPCWANPSTNPEPLTSTVPPPSVGPVAGSASRTLTGIGPIGPPSPPPTVVAPPSVCSPPSGPASAGLDRCPHAQSAIAMRSTRFMAA